MDLLDVERKHREIAKQLINREIDKQEFDRLYEKAWSDYFEKRENRSL